MDSSTDPLSEIDECSIWDYPRADNTMVTPNEDSDSDDSFYRLEVPTLEDKFDVNYARYFNEVISSTLLDREYSTERNDRISHNFEMFPDFHEKGTLRETDEYYDIFPSLNNSFESNSGRNIPDDNWCEEARFKEFYDNFTKNMKTPDNLSEEDSFEQTLNELINDLTFLGKSYRNVDSHSEGGKSNFLAQMDCRTGWDAGTSDEERELAIEIESYSIDEGEYLWPEPANIEKNFICYYCNYSTTQQRYLNYHINTKHIVRKYSCHICHFVTSHRDKLQKHIEEVHVYKCQCCDFNTFQKEELKEHTLKVHMIRDFWECRMCNYITPKKNKLRHHIEVAHPKCNTENGLEFKQFQCYSCPYSSSSNRDLALHLKTSHLEPKIDRCSMCGYRSKNWRDHEEHNDKLHVKLKFKFPQQVEVHRVYCVTEVK